MPPIEPPVLAKLMEMKKRTPTAQVGWVSYIYRRAQRRLPESMAAARPQQQHALTATPVTAGSRQRAGH